MRVMVNDRYPIGNRQTTGLGLNLSLGTCFRNIQINHGPYEGNVLVTSSLFIDRGPTTKLEHLYTTGWNYDGVVTFVSTEWLYNNPKLAALLSPASQMCIYINDLGKTDDCLRHLMVSCPELRAAAEYGRHLPPSFGGPVTYHGLSIPYQNIADTRQLSPCTWLSFSETPLGSYTRGPDGLLEYDTTESNDVYVPALAADIVLATMNSTSFWGEVISSDPYDSLPKTCYVTQDRFSLVSMKQTNPLIPLFGIDLLTAPLYLTSETLNRKLE